MRKSEYYEAGDEVEKAAERYEQKQVSFIERIKGKGGCGKREDLLNPQTTKDLGKML